MKFLIAALLITAIHADSKIYDIVSEYRNNGLNDVRATLEGYLIDKKYWESVLESKDTKYGYYESS